ncbi:hypothetical protein LCGC14_3138900 [marine sediment metagenome]|uniref:Uncharacterized protein n=1 Tax=marine sediment metagenome TaxID=412755 RepID=A0A0F8VXJ5_9ZZZZ
MTNRTRASAYDHRLDIEPVRGVVVAHPVHQLCQASTGPRDAAMPFSRSTPRQCIRVALWKDKHSFLKGGGEGLRSRAAKGNHSHDIPPRYLNKTQEHDKWTGLYWRLRQMKVFRRTRYTTGSLLGGSIRSFVLSISELQNRPNRGNAYSRRIRWKRCFPGSLDSKTAQKRGYLQRR